jgi:hypothetical protein
MPQERRSATRRHVDPGGVIYSVQGIRIAACRLRDISTAGAQIELLRETELPKTFLLGLSANPEAKRRCLIAWQSSTLAGVQFLEPSAVDGIKDTSGWWRRVVRFFRSATRLNFL